VLVYATPDDLHDWTQQPPPANAAVLLREASILVADAIGGDLYDVASTGLPAQSRQRDAVRDATCAQAGYWAVNSIDPAKGRAGMELVVTSSGIDGASVSTNAVDLEQAKADSLDALTPSAYRILRQAGMASAWVGSS